MGEQLKGCFIGGTAQGVLLRHTIRRVRPGLGVSWGWLAGPLITCFQK